MASKFDDIFGKKKEDVPVLDLSKATANTQEEYRRIIEKVPEFKIRPVKVRADDIKIKDKAEDQKFRTAKKEIKMYEKLGTRGVELKHFAFVDPIPVEMRSLKLDDLCSVAIDWKMLTPLRPKLKSDEEYFSRLVELGKSQLRSQMRDKNDALMKSMCRMAKNRAGILETRIHMCNECGEEFCDEKACMINNYDAFARTITQIERKPAQQQNANHAGGKRRIKKKTKKKPRSKSAVNQKPKKTKSKPSGAKSDSEL